MFRTVPLSIIRSFSPYTQQMVYAIQVCRQFYRDPDRKLSSNLYDIYHCCVYGEKLLMMDKEIVRNM
jgi:hypothetical protein